MANNLFEQLREAGYSGGLSDMLQEWALDDTGSTASTSNIALINALIAEQLVQDAEIAKKVNYAEVGNVVTDYENGTGLKLVIATDTGRLFANTSGSDITLTGGTEAEIASDGLTLFPEAYTPPEIVNQLQNQLPVVYNADTEQLGRRKLYAYDRAFLLGESDLSVVNSGLVTTSPAPFGDFLDAHVYNDNGGNLQFGATTIIGGAVSNNTRVELVVQKGDHTALFQWSVAGQQSFSFDALTGFYSVESGNSATNHTVVDNGDHWVFSWELLGLSTAQLAVHPRWNVGGQITANTTVRPAGNASLTGAGIVIGSIKTYDLDRTLDADVLTASDSVEINWAISTQDKVEETLNLVSGNPTIREFTNSFTPTADGFYVVEHSADSVNGTGILYATTTTGETTQAAVAAGVWNNLSDRIDATTITKKYAVELKAGTTYYFYTHSGGGSSQTNPSFSVYPSSYFDESTSTPQIVTNNASGYQRIGERDNQLVAALETSAGTDVVTGHNLTQASELTLRIKFTDTTNNNAWQIVDVDVDELLERFNGNIGNNDYSLTLYDNDYVIVNVVDPTAGELNFRSVGGRAVSYVYSELWGIAETRALHRLIARDPTNGFNGLGTASSGWIEDEKTGITFDGAVATIEQDGIYHLTANGVRTGGFGVNVGIYVNGAAQKITRDGQTDGDIGIYRKLVQGDTVEVRASTSGSGNGFEWDFAIIEQPSDAGVGASNVSALSTSTLYGTIASNEIGSLKQVPNVKEDGTAKSNAEHVEDGHLPLVTGYRLINGAIDNPKFALMYPSFVNGDDLLVTALNGAFVRNLGGNASSLLNPQAFSTDASGLRLPTSSSSGGNGFNQQLSMFTNTGSGTQQGSVVIQDTGATETRPFNFAMQFVLVLDSYAKEIMVEPELLEVEDAEDVLFSATSLADDATATLDSLNWNEVIADYGLVLVTIRFGNDIYDKWIKTEEIAASIDYYTSAGGANSSAVYDFNLATGGFTFFSSSSSTATVTMYGYKKQKTVTTATASLTNYQTITDNVIPTVFASNVNRVFIDLALTADLDLTTWLPTSSADNVDFQFRKVDASAFKIIWNDPIGIVYDMVDVQGEAIAFYWDAVNQKLSVR